jgi:polysaccharide biosynthesis protein PslG
MSLPRRPLPRPGRRGLIGSVAVLAAIVAAVVVLVISSGSAPRGGKAAAVGNRRFNRAAAGCTSSATAARPAEAHPSLLLGISASIRLEQGSQRCEQARLAADTGVEAVREDISWAMVEPREGQYDWSNYDAVVRTATEAGLMVLPILDDSPAWAAPAEDCLPSDPAGYASFAAAAVARYGPGGEFWRENPGLPARPLLWYELWNEPWDASCNREPAAYARLVVAAVSAARAVSPAVRFLIGGDTFYETLQGKRADWIAGMYAAEPDLGSYFDAFSVHPYGGDPAVYTPGGDTDNQPARLEQVHAELAAHGDGDKPLWVTEIGWSTCAGASGCVTEAEQARYLEEFLHDSLTTWRAYVRAVFVYDLRDIAPSPADDPQGWFGLLRPDLSRKPAWWVLRAFAVGSGG